MATIYTMRHCICSMRVVEMQSHFLDMVLEITLLRGDFISFKKGWLKWPTLGNFSEVRPTPGLDRQISA